MHVCSYQQELVLFSLTTPIQDDVIFTVPLELVSDILAHVSFHMP